MACSRRVDAALKIHTALTQTVWGSTQENDIASLRKKLERADKIWQRLPLPLDRGGQRLF